MCSSDLAIEDAVSIGLGAGDNRQAAVVAEIVKSYPGTHINQVFPAVGATRANLGGEESWINSLVSPSGQVGYVNISTGPVSAAGSDKAIVPVKSAIALVRDMGGNALKYFPMQGLKGMGQMLTLLAIVVTAGTVAKEHSMGTIKLLLIRAQSRSTILASKYVAVLLYLITLVAFMCAVAVLTGQITFGMDGGTVTLGDVLSAAVNNLVYTIVYVTLTFMVGILTRSTGPAIGIGMFIVIMESMVVQLLARYSWSKCPL